MIHCIEVVSRQFLQLYGGSDAITKLIARIEVRTFRLAAVAEDEDLCEFKTRKTLVKLLPQLPLVNGILKLNTSR